MKKLFSLVLALAMLASMSVAGVAEAVDYTKMSADLSLMTHASGITMDCALWAVDKVKETYPNVNITIEPRPSDNGEVITNRAAVGDLPDIVQITGPLTAALVQSESIIPLDNYVEEFNYFDKFSDSSIKNLFYANDGKIYQFPNGDASPIIWYYNSAVFEEHNVKVPENFDELMVAIEAFNAADVIPFALFGQQSWPIAAFMDSFLLRETDSGFKALLDGTANASDPGYKESFERISQALEAGIFQEGVTNTDFDTAYSLFTQGQAAMMLNGSWMISTAEKDMPETCHVMMSYPTMPADRATEKPHIYLNSGGINGLAVNAHTENPDLVARVAAEFNYWLLVAKHDMISDLAVPIKLDGLAELELSNLNKSLLEMMKIGNMAGLRHTYWEDKEFATVVGEEMQILLVGGSVEEFIDIVDDLK